MALSHRKLWLWLQYTIWIAATLRIGRLLLLWRYDDHGNHVSVGSTPNATLEFGAIYAVSRPSSPRRPVLERAAELAGLQIEIPGQPHWGDADVAKIQAGENSTLDRGSALAWLGHLHALKSFLQSSHETALIVEDDVDFDTHVRTEQIALTARAIRQVLDVYDSSYYYGPPSRWHILWLGHCGDNFGARDLIKLLPPRVFRDTTLPAFDDLHPWTRDFLRELRTVSGFGVIDDHRRLVYRSIRPLCTFAYGVTRAAARQLVDDFAASEGPGLADRPRSAFDWRLMEVCRDQGFVCLTVNPELFHHASARSEVAMVTSNSTMDGQELVEDKTVNIRCSARSSRWWSGFDELESPVRSSFSMIRVQRLARQPGYCYLDTAT